MGSTCQFPTTLMPDYPDSFMVDAKDGWNKLVFPNDAEKRFYRYNQNDYQGIIAFHGKRCWHNKCPDDQLTSEDHKNSDWEMKVNGQVVTDVINVGGIAWECYIIRGMNGFRFEPNEDGQYTIEIKVNKKEHFIQLFDF